MRSGSLLVDSSVEFRHPHGIAFGFAVSLDTQAPDCRDLLGLVLLKRLDPIELGDEPVGEVSAALCATKGWTGGRAGLPPALLARIVGAIATRAKGGIDLGVLLEADRALHLKDLVPEACRCETVCRLSFIYICPASLAVLFLTHILSGRESRPVGYPRLRICEGLSDVSPGAEFPRHGVAPVGDSSVVTLLSRCCHASIAEGGDLVAEVRRDPIQLSPREQRAGSPLLSMGDVPLSTRDSACAIVSA